MKRKWIIFAVVLVTALLTGTVAAVAYDSSRDDLIASGVTVAGVDVGGMRAGEARRVVAHELEEPLGKPVHVTHGDWRFKLTAEQADVHADVDGMIDDALEASRSGNIVSRVARDLTGGEEDAQVSAQVLYSRAAVTELVEHVVAKVDRPAQDAKLEFPSMEKVDSHPGYKVRADSLEQRVEQALSVPGVDRRVEVPVDRTKPKVTTAQLAKEYPVVLVADRSNFRLKLYEDLKLKKSYTVAVGALGFDTPAGLYHIQNKAIDPAWHVPQSDWAGDLAGTVVPGGVPENPLKARWMGIYDGAGIHGTDETYSLGSAASHGCIRMAIPDVIELYDQVPVGAPIYIA
ncbi:MAG: L,D-transpeptidase/peptidoglycan binding protein [Thermoleophilaceae bacterium]|nr:L,D-transpeptidase/peptidoglycan binding protein [Thermoleophilaceae bacterium]